MLVVHDLNHSICTRSIKDSCPRSLFQVSADVARLFKRQDKCWSAIVRKANNACDLACHRWGLECFLDPRVNGFHLLLLGILQDSFERNGLLLETVQQRDGVLGHDVIFLLNHNQSELGIYSALGTFLAESQFNEPISVELGPILVQQIVQAFKDVVAEQQDDRTPSLHARFHFVDIAARVCEHAVPSKHRACDHRRLLFLKHSAFKQNVFHHHARFAFGHQQ